MGFNIALKIALNAETNNIRALLEKCNFDDRF